jgi:hypothetical protein
MPFPTLITMGFTALEDSKYFQDTPIDASLSYETDGGLLITRRRYTRGAGRNIVTGFTALSQANKALLDTFYANQGGGSAQFTYVHPLTNENLQVRFSGEYKTAYKGRGGLWIWDVTDIKLRSV